MNVTRKPWQYLRPIILLSSFFWDGPHKVRHLTAGSNLLDMWSIDQSTQNCQEVIHCFLKFSKILLTQTSHSSASECHGFSYSDLVGHKRQSLFINPSAILRSSHRLCVTSHHIWIPHGHLGTKWVWDSCTLTCTWISWLCWWGRQTCHCCFQECEGMRWTVPTDRATSSIIASLLSCVYEADGLYIPLCVVMTWWLSGLYLGHEKFTHYFLNFNGHQGANLHNRFGIYRSFAVKGYTVDK